MARAESGITPCTSPLRLIERPLSATNTRRMSERRGERETLFCSSLSPSLSPQLLFDVKPSCCCRTWRRLKACSPFRDGNSALAREKEKDAAAAAWLTSSLLRLSVPRPLQQCYSDNNGVSLSPSHFFFLASSSLRAAAAIFHCRPPSEPKGEKERRPRDPVLVLPPPCLLCNMSIA